MKHQKWAIRLRHLIASLTLLTLGGCGDSSGPKVQEDLGVQLLPIGFYNNGLIWTRDGTELVYKTPGDGPNTSALKAVNVSTLAVRQLVAPGTFISTVLRSGIGERIYFGIPPTGDPPNFRVSRVHPVSGVVESLITTLYTGDDDFMEISADERFLAIGRLLFDLQTGAQTSLPPGLPFGFSPDGTKLLYYLDVAGASTPSPTLISTADGSYQPLHSTGYFHLAHRWEGNSPQLLRTDSEFISGNNYTVRLSEIDGVTGVTRDIAQFSTTGYTDPYAVNWSFDGRTLAAWIQQDSRTNLYVIRSGNVPTLVASVTGPPGPPVFSPSGSSIAYFYYHPNGRWSVYMKSGI